MNLGEHVIKKNFITAEPEIRRYDYDTSVDEFLVIASDGIFDKFTS